MFLKPPVDNFLSKPLVVNKFAFYVTYSKQNVVYILFVYTYEYIQLTLDNSMWEKSKISNYQKFGLLRGLK